MISFIHSHFQELAESLTQDLNDNNKYNMKKSLFPHISNGIILKSLMICFFLLMGSHGHDNFRGLINYENVFRLDGYCI